MFARNSLKSMSMMLTRPTAVTTTKTNVICRSFAVEVKHIAREQRSYKSEQLRKANTPGYNEKGHKILTNDDIAEIKRLRAENPDKYSQIYLAKKFECSRLQIAIHAPTPDRKRQTEIMHELIAKDKLEKDKKVKQRRLDAWRKKVTETEHKLWAEKLQRKEENKRRAAEIIAAKAAAKAEQAKAQALRQAQREKERDLARNIERVKRAEREQAERDAQQSTEKK